MSDSQDKAEATAGGNDSGAVRDPVGAPSSAVSDAASGPTHGEASEPVASDTPAPSPFLFADAARFYAKPAEPVPAPPEEVAEIPIAVEELPVEIAPVFHMPPPVLLDMPVDPPRRLTVPPSPLGPPPKPAERAVPPPKSVNPIVILGAIGAVVLLGMGGIIAFIAARAPAQRSAAAPTLPVEDEAPRSTLETSSVPLDTSSEDDTSDGGTTAGGARAHRRREGAGANSATSAAARAAAAARRDPTMPPNPSAEQVAMAARSVRGPILMCGMSLPATSPANCDITVTFNSSGHVVSASAGAPFAGTGFGNCVEGAARRMTVPPFYNPTFRATQSFRTH